MFFLVFLVTYYVIPRKVADRPIPRKKEADRPHFGLIQESHTM